MKIEIDDKSGFCFGVVHAIEAAERELAKSDMLYCLGDIVHNSIEVERLTNLGLKIIDHEQFRQIRNARVLIRAHGEPPETYATAKKNNITLIDASCPIVLSLQNKIRLGYDEIMADDGQIIIFGKEGHAEVIGLKGQANGNVIVISDFKDLDQIDFSKPVRFFAQTTQNPDEFKTLHERIRQQMEDVLGRPGEINFKAYDSICRQVSNRAPELKRFAQKHDVVIFVSDPKSSNGMFLYSICKSSNQRTHFAAHIDDIKPEWIRDAASVGICGATSTPRWVMEEIREKIAALSK